MSDHILCLDQGTTSSRAVLLRSDGAVVGIAQREFKQYFPQPGWVEHDANEIWQSQRAVAKSVLKKAGVSAQQVAAIGIANQRETTVVWDRQTGQPVGPAIVWQDRRTAEHCRRLQRSVKADDMRQKTGLVIDAYFSATKIAWILSNTPGARELARAGRLAFGTVDSWLLWNLTGGKESAGALHCTDVTNASRTMLCDLEAGDWDSGLLRTFKIPKSMMPTIVPSSGVVAHTRKGVLGCEIPVAGIAGDQHAALVGQMCLKPGMVKNTYGTGCFLLMNVGRKPKRSNNSLLSTVGWGVGKQKNYALEGSVFIAGAVVQWLRDGLGLIKKSADVERLAASVPDNGGVFLVPAFSGLGAPYWDPLARGSINGLTRGSSAGHLARAALESMAFQTKDVLDAMQKDSRMRIRSLRVDGGASTNDLLMQFQADILDVPVVRPRTSEATALGAGFLAGVAVGIWESLEEIAEHWQIEREFLPSMAKGRREEMLAGWKKAVGRSRDWAS